MRPTRWLLFFLAFLTPFGLAASLFAQQEAWEKRMHDGEDAWKRGNTKEAEKNFKAAVKEAEKLGPNNLHLEASLRTLVSFYTSTKRFGDTIPWMLKVVKIKEGIFGPKDPAVAAALGELGFLYLAKVGFLAGWGAGVFGGLKDLRTANPEYAGLGAISPNIGSGAVDTRSTLPETQADPNDSLREAERVFQRALAIRETAFGQDHPDVAASLDNLTALYYAWEKYDKALQSCERSLAIREKLWGQDHLDVAFNLDSCALLLRKKHRQADADKLQARAKAIRAKSSQQKPPE